MRSLVLESGARWGDVACDFQIEDAQRILAMEGPPYAYLTRARGGHLALDTPLPTTTGWTTMGEVQIGDELVDECGQPCSVTQVHPVERNLPCYRITFTDGTTVVASSVHEWVVRLRGPRSAGTSTAEWAGMQKLTTADLAATLPGSVSIPNCFAWQLPEAPLPFPPYLLGAWLGDGHTASATITVGDEDFYEMAKEFAREGFPFSKGAPSQNISYRFGTPLARRITGHPTSYDSAHILRDLGVIGNKHIPFAYRRASAAQRFDLLCGLMDTDGTVHGGKARSGNVVYTSTLRHLAEQVAELVVSLGWRATLHTRTTDFGGQSYRYYTVTFRPDRAPFRLQRKVNRWRPKATQAVRTLQRMVKTVEPIPAVPVRCISVDSPSHLYLCGTGAVPTHNSKTSDLAGICLASMLSQAPPGAHLYWLAADRTQGKLGLESIQGFVARTPELVGAVEITAHGCRAGATELEILPADVASAWGLRPWFLIVDELAQWKQTDQAKGMWTATTSALVKYPEARLVVLTSAGAPSHWSWTIIADASTDPMWWVHEVEGPPPWATPDKLAEQRRRLPEATYLRLFENRWTEHTDILVNRDDLEACITHEGWLDYDPRYAYVVGLDVGQVNDRTAIVLCHGVQNPDRTQQVIVDRVYSFQGSRADPVSFAAIEAELLNLYKIYGCQIIADPWQARDLVERLVSRGLRAEIYDFSPASINRLALTLHQLMRAHRLALPRTAALLDELSHVRMKETKTTPGVYRIDHDSGRHDDRAIALALAAVWLLDRPTYTWDEVWNPTAEVVETEFNPWSEVWGSVTPARSSTPSALPATPKKAPEFKKPQLPKFNLRRFG